VFTATSATSGISNYQWKKNGVNVGTNSSTYSGNTFVTGDVITCTITSTANCLSASTATSNSITLTVEIPPALSLGMTKDFVPAPLFHSMPATLSPVIYGVPALSLLV
jgi:hypothetical protein